jgi:ABC-type Fe3+ transport system substrate-binding protein
MIRNGLILLAAAVVVAVPFAMRPRDAGSDWRPGPPTLTIASPHNEAIRYEFEHAFSKWHRQHYGQPVKIDWLSIGGTTEISRYLTSEYVASFRAWWKGLGKPWPAGAGEALVNRREPEDPSLKEMYQAFRATDDTAKFSARIDLFFGGGEYDHSRAHQQGLTVAPWKSGEEPRELLAQVPEAMSGETWRTPHLFGAAVSTFGICYNVDRLRDLGVTNAPSQWRDLAAPVYYQQLGVADPTKSGSIAKAFEMIIHQQMHEAVQAGGFSVESVAQLEKEGGTMPAAYQAAIGQGWFDGIRLVQLICANARYFIDSASKVPIDVGAGDAAAGLAIDFYARYQAQLCRGTDGRERMVYITPVGGSSVSCDPISLLRGAPNREVAVRFIEFVLSREGQALWNSPVGEPCSTVEKYALRRLPIRRDFYEPNAAACAVDNLLDPAVNPYALAEHFTYHRRWTGSHFGVHRDLIKAMCLDAGEELRAAWGAILANGGPVANPEAMRWLQRMPDKPKPLTWLSALEIARGTSQMEYMRQWTECFRENYRRAREEAERR